MTRRSRRYAKRTATAIAARPVGSIEQHAPHVAEVVNARINERIIRRSLDLLAEKIPVTVLPMPPAGKRLEPTTVDGPALDLICNG